MALTPEKIKQIESDAKTLVGGLWDSNYTIQLSPNDIRELATQYYRAGATAEAEKAAQGKEVEFTQKGWISVEDMPDFDGEYLCILEIEQECHNVWVRQEVVQCVFNNWVVKHNQTVTHWQPLPAPPDKQ